MKILISGIAGHMGHEVEVLAQSGFQNAVACAGVDRILPGSSKIPCFTSFDEAPANVDVIVDFSHPSALTSLLKYAVSNRIPAVIATTGYTEEQRTEIRNAAEKIPVFYAANYSVGIAVLIRFAKQAAAAFPDADIEIVETHHHRKADAPSGTALAIAESIREVRPGSTINAGRNGIGKRTKEEIGIHAIRMGNIVGEHEVIIGTENQSLTLTHKAYSRALFAEGALTAASFLIRQSNGLYDMDSLLKTN